MSSLASFRTLPKAFLLYGLLLAAIMFDGGPGMVGFVFSGESRQFGAQAAGKVNINEGLLKEVMPGADSFSDKEGEVPVYKAYRTDAASGEKTLMGYAYLTADVPPEANGFSAPIDVLVGLDLEGTIIGLKVVYYRESLRSTWGDFLSDSGFQEQFVGKHASENFRVNYDVDGIAQATITVRAMSKGIRQSIRKVARAYLQ